MTAPLDELKALTDLLRAAQGELAGGQVRTLEGVDERVAALCQIIECASPAEQKTYLPALTALMDHFAGYEQDLRRLQDGFDEASHG